MRIKLVPAQSNFDFLSKGTIAGIFSILLVEQKKLATAWPHKHLLSLQMIDRN